MNDEAKIIRDRIKHYEDIMRGYPENHRERIHIQVQIDEMRNLLSDLSSDF